MPDFTFHPDESFNGAVARWADEIGGLERMSELTAIAGVQYGHRQYAAFSSPEQISALAAVMEVDPAELMARATPHVEVVSGHPRHTFFGTTVSTMLLEKRFRRFSPTSLAEAPYDRALWNIRLLPFCPTSWEILVETCPYCGKRPGWQYTLGIASCEGQCMTDLRTAVTPVVPKEIRSELEAVVGLIHPDPLRRARTITLLPPSLRAAGSATTLDLLVRLIPVVDPNLPRRISDLWKVDPLVLCHAIARTWEVVMGWPHALNALASRRIATRTTRRTDGNGGRTLHFVSPRCGAEIPPTIAPLIKAWRESVDLQGPRGPTILASTLSITDVAKMIGVRTGQVADIRRQGAIETVFVLDAGRPEPRHDPSQFEDILDLRDTRQPMCGARQELGVSCHGVEQLVAMHLLDQDLHPFVTARYDGMQIVSSSMAVLQDAVVTAGRGDPAVCTVSLHQSMKGIGGRLKPWGPAFAALVAGSLGHVVRQGSEPIARRVMIQPSGFKAIMAMKFDRYDPTYREIAYADHMSKIDAGETLNLNPRATTSLLSVVQTKAGTRKKLVPVSLVLDLAVVHMPLTELAARRGVNKRRAYWDAIKAGVPFLGPGGFCREAAEKLYFG